MNKLETLFRETKTPSQYGKGYLDYLAEILRSLDSQKIEEVIHLFDQARISGKTIFFIGNGGSAATCSHFANDFSLAARGTDAVPFKAISLCDNNALVSAIANDVGYEGLFVEQLKTLAQKGDLLMAISASGNSHNLLRAIEYADSHEMITVGIVGFDGGKMKTMCRYFLHIPTKGGEYGPSEDAALVLDHLISSYLTYRIYGEKLGFRPAHSGYEN